MLTLLNVCCKILGNYTHKLITESFPRTHFVKLSAAILVVGAQFVKLSAAILVVMKGDIDKIQYLITALQQC